MGWLARGVAAATMCDLGFHPRVRAGIFQLISAPGLLAHGLELTNKPITAMPFLHEHHYDFNLFLQFCWGGCIFPFNPTCSIVGILMHREPISFFPPHISSQWRVGTISAPYLSRSLSNATFAFSPFWSSSPRRFSVYLQLYCGKTFSACISLSASISFRICTTF